MLVGGRRGEGGEDRREEGGPRRRGVAWQQRIRIDFL